MTWDHGPEGSIAEDAFFALIAMSKGYKFGFIPGTWLVQQALIAVMNESIANSFLNTKLIKYNPNEKSQELTDCYF